MCENHEDHGHLSRRSILGAGAGSALLGLSAHGAAAAPLLVPTRAAALSAQALPTGLLSRSHAMHLHASSSEGTGSWEAHLEIAHALGVDVVWASDHDWRVDATHTNFRTRYDFTTLADWITWAAASGTPSGSYAITTITDSSPYAGSKALSLAVPARSKPARVRTASSTNDSLTGCVRGRRIEAPVLVTAGALDIYVTFSRHAGKQLQIQYRFGNVSESRTLTSATAGLVKVSAPLGQWSQVSIDPVVDLAALWPAIDPEDNSITAIDIAAVPFSSGAQVLIPYLLLPREQVGAAAATAREAMLDRLAPRFPSVDLARAQEYSYPPGDHLNGFFSGTAPLLPDTYAYARASNYASRVAEGVHAAGGVIALNHPFGTSGSTEGTPAAQTTKAIQVARTLIGNQLHGIDLIEVGYPRRGGVGIEAALLQLATMLWRDGWFVTANGASDDHTSTEQGWRKNPFLTHVWAASAARADQLAAMAQGRVYCTSFTAYQGRLWLDLDGAPMGSVRVDPVTTGSASLTVTATDLPTGASVSVYRGAVDYPGATVSAPGLELLGSFPATALTSGSLQLSPAKDRSCYYLAAVRLSNGTLVGFSNPVWELKAENATRPVPAARRA